MAVKTGITLTAQRVYYEGVASRHMDYLLTLAFIQCLRVAPEMRIVYFKFGPSCLNVAKAKLLAYLSRRYKISAL